MDIGFTEYLWLNWILVGLLFGIGKFLAQAIYSAAVWTVSQRRSPPE